MYFLFDLVVPCLGTYPKNNKVIILLTLAAATKTSFTVCQALTQVVYIKGFFESFQYLNTYR